MSFAWHFDSAQSCAKSLFSRAARLAAVLTATAVMTPQAARAGGLPFSPKTETLPNGLRLVMIPYDSPGLVAYYSLVRVGSRDEVEKGVTGFAHFFEHMMFRGTELHPPAKVSALLKKAGADQNGFTTDDFTCYTFLGSAKYLEELVAYEADRFQNLKYSDADFKTEAGAVLGEYNKNSSRAYLPLIESLRETVFKKHTYGHTTLGYLADIKDMPNQYEYSLSFFKRFYTPDNVTLIVVGDFDQEKLKSLVTKHYGPWATKRAKTKTRAEPRQRKELRTHVDFPSKTLPKLSLAWRAPATNYDSADTAVYNILHELLFGETSALYTDLVLGEQKVASFEDWAWSNHRDPYLVHAVAHLKNKDDLKEVESRVLKAIGLLQKGKIDKATLDAVKSRVRYSLLLSMSTPDKIAVTLARYMASTGQVDGLSRLLASIEKLSVKDVKRFAQRYLKRSNMTVLTMVTKGGAK